MKAPAIHPALQQAIVEVAKMGHLLPILCKPLQYKGRPERKDIRIVDILRRGKNFVLAVIYVQGEDEMVDTIDPINLTSLSDGSVLENAPEIAETHYINVYSDGLSSSRHLSKKEADQSAAHNRIGQIKVVIMTDSTVTVEPVAIA